MTKAINRQAKAQYALQVGVRVGRAISEKGLTQKQVAARAKMGEGTLSTIISGKHGVKMDQIDALASAIGVTRDSLLPESSRAKSPPATDMLQNDRKVDYGPDHPLQLLPEIENYLVRRGNALTEKEQKRLRVWASTERDSVPLTDDVIEDYLVWRRGIEERVAQNLRDGGKSRS